MFNLTCHCYAWVCKQPMFINVLIFHFNNKVSLQNPITTHKVLSCVKYLIAIIILHHLLQLNHHSKTLTMQTENYSLMTSAEESLVSSEKVNDCGSNNSCSSKQTCTEIKQEGTSSSGELNGSRGRCAGQKSRCMGKFYCRNANR